MRLVATLLAIFCLSSDGATYYVSSAGSDSADGSYLSPFLTAGKAATVAMNGDSVVVRGPATFDERVTPRSGTTWIGNGYPVLRGFDLTALTNVSVIGFEITHSNTAANYHAVLMSGAGSCLIQDNYIHHVRQGGVRIGTTFGNLNIVRSNYIYSTGWLTGTNYDSAAAVYCFGTNNLIEYNRMARCSDFVSGLGYRNIVRNNRMEDVQTVYFSGTAPHVDGWESQPASTNAAVGSTWLLFEANTVSSNYLADSHALLLQSTAMNQTDAGINVGNAILRGNVVANLGSYVSVVAGWPRGRWYNNTVFGASKVSDDGVSGGTFALTAASNWIAANNIYSSIGIASNTPIYVTNAYSSGLASDYDIRHLSGGFGASESHGTSNNPAFTDTASEDFRLSVGSPAIAAAGPVVSTTSGATNSTSLDVSDASAFSDGWGIADGDRILVGSSAVSVSGVDYVSNRVTLTTAATWTNGAPVRWSSDVGALPYGSLPPSLSGLTFSTNGMSATVSDTNNVRFVEFLVAGVPIGIDYTSPYSVSTSVPYGSPIEARAYPRFSGQSVSKIQDTNSLKTLLVLTEATARGHLGRQFDDWVYQVRREGVWQFVQVIECPRFAGSYSSNTWSTLNYMSNAVRRFNPGAVQIVGRLPGLRIGGFSPDGHNTRCAWSFSWLGCTNLAFTDTTSWGMSGTTVMESNVPGDGTPDELVGAFSIPVAVIDFSGMATNSTPGTFASGYLAGQGACRAVDEDLALRQYFTNNLSYRRQGWTNAQTGLAYSALGVVGEIVTRNPLVTWTQVSNQTNFAGQIPKMLYEQLSLPEFSPDYVDGSGNWVRGFWSVCTKSYNWEGYEGAGSESGVHYPQRRLASGFTDRPLFLVATWMKHNISPPRWFCGASDITVADAIRTSAAAQSGSISFDISDVHGDLTLQIPRYTQAPPGRATVATLTIAH